MGHVTRIAYRVVFVSQMSSHGLWFIGLHKPKSRPGLLMTGGLVFLGAVGLSVGAYEAMKVPEKKGFDWTQVEFPGMSCLGLAGLGGGML